MPHRAVYKSSSIEFLDDFYIQDLAGAVAFGQGVLANPSADALGVATAWAQESSFDANEIDGFQTQWLDDESPLGEHEVDRIVRLAYREALSLASGHTPVVPIETFWVREAGADFEVHIHDGAQRVTMFMFLPLERDYGSERASTYSWVVRAGDLDDVRADAPRRALDDEPEPVMLIQVSGPLPNSSSA